MNKKMDERIAALEEEVKAEHELHIVWIERTEELGESLAGAREELEAKVQRIAILEGKNTNLEAEVRQERESWERANERADELEDDVRGLTIDLKIEKELCNSRGEARDQNGAELTETKRALMEGRASHKQTDAFFTLETGRLSKERGAHKETKKELRDEKEAHVKEVIEYGNLLATAQRASDKEGQLIHDKLVAIKREGFKQGLEAAAEVLDERIEWLQKMHWPNYNAIDDASKIRELKPEEKEPQAPDGQPSKEFDHGVKLGLEKAASFLQGDGYTKEFADGIRELYPLAPEKEEPRECATCHYREETPKRMEGKDWGTGMWRCFASTGVLTPVALGVEKNWYLSGNWEEPHNCPAWRKREKREEEEGR